MLGMLFAEGTVLGNGKSVGVVALILITVVIAVLANSALESYLCSDICFLSHVEKTPYKKITPPFWVLIEFSIRREACQPIFKRFWRFYLFFRRSQTFLPTSSSKEMP